MLPGDELTFARHRYKIDYNVAPDTPLPPPLEDEEDLGTSRLEKADLLRRRAQPPSSPAAGNGHLPHARTKGPNPDEDRAVEWLNDDDR